MIIGFCGRLLNYGICRVAMVMYIVINLHIMTELRPGFVDGEMLHTKLLKEI